MLARLVPAAVAVLLLLAGCGGDSTERRDEIAAYIDRANQIQTSMTGPLADVTQANREFAQAKTPIEKVQPKLARAERSLRTLRRRLAALSPPPDARRLQTLLLELVDAEAGLAHEVRQLAQFLPKFSAALRPLEPANRRLQDALAAEGTENDKADALDRYRADLAAVLERLHGLRPPPMSAPAYETQVRTLRRVRAAAAELAAALRERRADDVQRLVRKMGAAALAGVSVPAQKAQIAAIKAYNARIEHVDELAASVERERARLQRLVE